MQISEIEKNIGIELFYTKTKGINGKLRTIVDDFIVDEISIDRSLKDNGNVTIAEIKANNWETNNLIRNISNQLRISRKRISFAGTKDKRAISTQQFSFYNVKPEIVKNISLKDVEIKSVFTTDKMIRIGDLKGNHFQIKIRNISKVISNKKLNEILEPIKEINGFPNFFGIQRFGITRPLTHTIGKHIVNANFKKAVYTYLTYLSKDENIEAYNARKKTT